MKKYMLLKNITRRAILLLSVLVMATGNSLPVGAEILIDKALIEKGITQYDSRVSRDTCDGDDGPATTGDVDRFLQVLADQESGGNPRAESSLSSASGKYQYIDGTWRARKTIYPPSGQYARASAAPEAVQDAVAYIEYSQKFVDLDGDIFKLAVSHFYPAANTNPALLDIAPGNNSITPREYAESVLSKITEGVGTNIPLLYRQAPEFDTYNKAGAPAATPDATPSQPQNPSQGPTAAAGHKVFLDPGHGGAVAEYTDTVTGLRDRETSNAPEGADVLDVARRVKAALEPEGFTVTLARNNNQASVNKRERVEAAKRADADIAVSIHTTPGELNDVWAQKVGTYREYGDKRVEFTNTATARKSQRYASIFSRTRSVAEDRAVDTDSSGAHQRAAFSRADLPSKGDISLVQLWAQDIPWVYNEFARGASNGLSEQDKQNYADGITEGIRQALGAAQQDGGAADCVGGGSNFAGGNLSETVLAYAWPEHHSAPYFRMMPAYKTAVEKAQSEGRYVGGGIHPGIDCGGFVTTLLIDSGFEPNYNHSGRGGNTVTQKAWADANWQRLGSGSGIDTGTLQPGDVAFSPGHTFVYVGDIPNFGSKIASASYSTTGASWRTPMAGSESITSGSVTWYRKR